jgi:hypothetical protein
MDSSPRTRSSSCARSAFSADNLSVDEVTLPYEDLRDAIIDERIEFPPYVTFRNIGDTDAKRSLSENSCSSRTPARRSTTRPRAPRT